ncbi:LysR family transcriptional regulator [Paracoccus aminophilus]|uniref:Transcriptional regulator, LysR family n=1 Tax=Paracoccus aminophilus JCM 7686 TaxID=1367847 RepID=S5XTW0_PARAH|nr:LysR substrate-binding domain-containing protein [Paracoccus aminophilus]AGT10954.1 transcriptional regulator, LysR family [Paracoccus aminophilus JCM 7686]
MQPFSRMLTYFVEVARQGSIRKASEKLNVSASAIDRQVLLAEEMLGVRLFNRLPGGMQLTSPGELMLRGALEWRRDFAAIERQIADLSGLRRGHVRLGIIGALATGFLPRLLARLRQDYPGVTVEVTVLANDAVGLAIAAGQVELGLCLNPRPSRETEIHAHREIPLGLALPPGHAFAQKPRPRFAWLAECEVIRPQEPLEIAELFDALEAASGLSITPVARANDISMIRALIRAGAGVSLMSQLDLAEDESAGRIVFVPLAEPLLRPTRLALCHGRHAPLSTAATLVLHAITAEEGWQF